LLATVGSCRRRSSKVPCAHFLLIVVDLTARRWFFLRSIPSLCGLTRINFVIRPRTHTTYLFRLQKCFECNLWCNEKPIFSHHQLGSSSKTNTETPPTPAIQAPISGASGTTFLRVFGDPRQDPPQRSQRCSLSSRHEKIRKNFFFLTKRQHQHGPY